MLAASLSADPAFGCTSPDEVSLDISQAAEDGNHQPACAGAGIRPRLRQRAELRTGIYYLFHDGEEVEGRTSQPIDPRHHHDVAGRKLLQQLDEFTSIGPCTAGLLPINPLTTFPAKLFELPIKSLAIGADPGVPEATILSERFDHILRNL